MSIDFFSKICSILLYISFKSLFGVSLKIFVDLICLFSEIYCFLPIICLEKHNFGSLCVLEEGEKQKRWLFELFWKFVFSFCLVCGCLINNWCDLNNKAPHWHFTCFTCHLFTFNSIHEYFSISSDEFHVMLKPASVAPVLDEYRSIDWCHLPPLSCHHSTIMLCLFSAVLHRLSYWKGINWGAFCVAAEGEERICLECAYCLQMKQLCISFEEDPLAVVGPLLFSS